MKLPALVLGAALAVGCSASAPKEETGAEPSVARWTRGFTGIAEAAGVEVPLTEECEPSRTVAVHVVLSRECLLDPVPYAWGWPTGELLLEYAMEAGPENEHPEDCDGTSEDDAEVTISVTGPDGVLRTSDHRTLEPGAEAQSASLFEDKAWSVCAANETCDLTWLVELELVDGEAARVSIGVDTVVRACSSGDPTDGSYTLTVE